ncbi:MAG TPA: FHA domain-containing protein [Candidatus Sumerlaeota bacterium]|nr:FHA domain-containing protein [Candidatus Sumerlaeota bacterium]
MIAGPLDGLSFEGRKASVRIGRSDGTGPGDVRNDLILQRDSYASSFHAEITHQEGSWQVRDLNSTNGTWVGARKLERGEQVAVGNGEVFVIGNTAIQLTEKPAGLPAIDASISAILSPASQTMINRARTLARELNQPWVGVAAVFRVLAQSDAPPLPDFFKALGVDPAAAEKAVLDFEYWKDELDWIGKEVMRGRRPAGQIRNVVPTPRLQLVLTLADRVRENQNEPNVEPQHVLAAMMVEPGNIVLRALAEAGHATAALRQATENFMKPPPEKKAEPEPLAEPEPEPAETTARISLPGFKGTPLRKPVDPETWLLARQAMDRIEVVQNDYSMADPAVRFDALCTVIRDAVQKAPGPKRALLIEQLHYLFPVLEEAVLPPPPSLFHEQTPASLQGGEITDHELEGTGDRARMRPSDDVSATLKADRSQPQRETTLDTDYMLQQVFATEKLAPLGASSESDSQFLRLMQLLYTFALDMERLAKGMVQSLQGGGGGESRYFLPFTMQDLKMMVQKILEQKADPETVVDIHQYLSDLSHWLIALIAAHQKGTVQWYGELWERISPAGVRNETKVSSLNKVLGQSKADLWETYERLARDLKPEIVEDQFKEKLSQLVTEEFRRLSSRRE